MKQDLLFIISFLCSKSSFFETGQDKPTTSDALPSQRSTSKEFAKTMQEKACSTKSFAVALGPI